MGRLLVVDDRDEICEIIAIYLRAEGHDVTVLNQGVQARRALERGRFDAVIIDVVLPGMSGLALAEIADAQAVPVVLISGDLEAIAELQGRRERTFLRKPFHLPDLSALLHDILAGAPASLADGTDTHG